MIMESKAKPKIANPSPATPVRESYLFYCHPQAESQQLWEPPLRIPSTVLKGGGP
jgi:hypothetical protein